MRLRDWVGVEGTPVLLRGSDVGVGLNQMLHRITLTDVTRMLHIITLMLSSLKLNRHGQMSSWGGSAPTLCCEVLQVCSKLF